MNQRNGRRSNFKEQVTGCYLCILHRYGETGRLDYAACGHSELVGEDTYESGMLKQKEGLQPLLFFVKVDTIKEKG